MPLFRRRHAEVPHPSDATSEPLAVSSPSDVPNDPLARYADVVTIIVRHTVERDPTDPDFDVATVDRFAVGGDVPAEELRDPTLRWLLDEARYTNPTDLTIRRTHFHYGASGASAEIVLSLIGGAAEGLTGAALGYIVGRLAGGTSHFSPNRWHGSDDLRFVVAKAFDVRPSDLSLVEQRSSENRLAAVYRDSGDRHYGVRIEKDGRLTIRRLQVGDW